MSGWEGRVNLLQTNTLAKRMRRFFFILGVFVFFYFSLTSAEAVNLNLQEGKVRLNILPGKSKSGLITIKNADSSPVNLRLYLEDWYYIPPADGSKDFKPAGTTHLSSAPWISFTPAEFMIPANTGKVVTYTVNVPADAQGGRYAVLFFESILAKSAQELEGVGVGVAVRIGSLFYIQAEGTIKRKAVLTNLKVEKDSKNSPLNIRINFKNTGNVDITTSGTFHIIDKSGMVYARGEFDQLYTFPDDEGILKAQWPEPLAAGKYDLVVTLDLGRALEEVGMGKGPLLVKEAQIEIGPSGKVIFVSPLK